MNTFPTDAGEIVLRTLTHLKDQGRKSSNGFFCLYRHPEGLKCAVGYWIPDDFPITFEINAIDDHLLSLLPESDLRTFLKDNQEILKELQRFHDTFLPAQWDMIILKEKAIEFFRVNTILREHIGILENL